MINNKKNILLSLLSLFLIFCSTICAGIGGSKLKSIQVDVASQLIANKSKSNYESNVFLSYHNLTTQTVNNIYSKTYNTNFSVHFCEILSYCNDTAFANFKFSCGKSSRENISICDALAYSNSSVAKTFETININLYKTPNKTEELETFDLNGFLYIPDYIADDIIEKSEGELKTYLDLVPDLTTWSEEKREEFLEKYSIVLENDGILFGKFKIANIFHVDGFKDDAYKYSDRGAGKIYKQFFGDFLIGHGKSIFNKYHKCIVSFFDSKRFVIAQETNKYIDNSGSSDFLINFYNVASSHPKKIITSYETNSFQNISVPYVLLLVLSVLFCISALLLFFVVMKRASKRLGLLALLISPLLIYEIILQILYITALKNSIRFISIYNLVFNIPIIIYIIFGFVCLYIIQRKNNVKV